MDNETAANFYEQDAAEALAAANSHDKWALQGDFPKDWLEEHAAAQLTNANRCRR